MACPSWYDIVSLSRSRSDEACAGLDESAARVHALAEAEIARGVAPARVALAGFSQGGALALWSALAWPRPDAPLGGAFALSGYLPRAHAAAPDARVAAATRARLFHGDADGVVAPAYAADSEARLRAVGVRDVALRTYAGLAHASSPEELADVVRELRALLEPPPTAAELRAASAKELKALLAEAGVARAEVAQCVEKSELLALAVARVPHT